MLSHSFFSSDVKVTVGSWLAKKQPHRMSFKKRCEPQCLRVERMGIFGMADWAKPMLKYVAMREISKTRQTFMMNNVVNELRNAMYVVEPYWWNGSCNCDEWADFIWSSQSHRRDTTENKLKVIRKKQHCIRKEVESVLNITRYCYLDGMKVSSWMNVVYMPFKLRLSTNETSNFRWSHFRKFCRRRTMSS